jgi:hypothetical protein
MSRRWAKGRGRWRTERGRLLGAGNCNPILQTAKEVREAPRQWMSLTVTLTSLRAWSSISIRCSRWVLDWVHHASVQPHEFIRRDHPWYPLESNGLVWIADEIPKIIRQIQYQRHWGFLSTRSASEPPLLWGFNSKPQANDGSYTPQNPSIEQRGGWSNG